MVFLRFLSVLLLVTVLAGCGGGGSSDSTVIIPVTIPVANNDAFTLDADARFTGDLSVNDIQSENGGNVWSLLTDPSHGDVMVDSDGQFQYTPNFGYVGEDSFSYRLTDVDGDSDSALVSLLMSPIVSINDPLFSDQWYVENTGQVTKTGTGTPGADIRVMGTGTGTDEYAQGYTGDGVEIAIIDEGLEIDHIDLAPNVVLNGSYNFSSTGTDGKQFDPTATGTDGDHGTSVAGLAAARGGNAEGLWGTAPSAELKGFNFLAVQEFNVELAALGYAAAADDFTGLSSPEVDIFNKSYGRNPDIVPTGSDSAYYESLVDAMRWGTQNLRGSKGAIYIKAGGNEFDGGDAFSAVRCSDARSNGVTCYNVNMESEHASPYEMVVGAFNADDTHADYANTGSALWLVAPGGQSLGMITTDQSGCDKGYNQTTRSYDSSCNYLTTFAGTSAATPLVSGAVALLLEAYPDLTWREVKHILASTARKLDSTLSAKTISVDAPDDVILEAGWVDNAAGYHFSNLYGFGALSVDAAMTMTLDWKANTTTLPALQTLTKGVYTLSTNNVIPDDNAVGLSPIPNVAVTESLTAESVALTLSIEATSGTDIDISDYQIILESPNGTQSILLTPFNAYRSGVNMTDLTLITHAFYGETITGDWKLIIRDLDAGGEGKLTKWSLKFYGHES